MIAAKKSIYANFIIIDKTIAKSLFVGIEPPIASSNYKIFQKGGFMQRQKDEKGMCQGKKIRGIKAIGPVLIVLAYVICMYPVNCGAVLDPPTGIIERSCGETNIGGKKILIAYASKHGATSSISAKIADVLCLEGFQVDLKLARKVKDISEYDAVIIGSPIYIGQWLRGAKQFLNKYQDALADKQLGVFITCTYLKDDNDTPERRAHAKELYIDPIFEDLPDIQPVSFGILSGEFLYRELYPVEFILMKLAKFSEGDFRNEDKISAWALELSALLQ
jgi:menaquinone-dependent protoporphyrinogen oxidase